MATFMIWLYKGTVSVTNMEGTLAILFVGFPSGCLLRQTMSHVTESRKGLPISRSSLPELWGRDTNQILRPTLPSGSLSLYLLGAFIAETTPMVADMRTYLLRQYGSRILNFPIFIRAIKSTMTSDKELRGQSSPYKTISHWNGRASRLLD